MLLQWNVTFPLLSIGCLLLVLSFIFYCYLRYLKCERGREKGFRKVCYKAEDGEACGNKGTCAICLEDYTNKELIAECTCLHCFHIKCISQWLKEENFCPVCKAVLTTNLHRVNYYSTIEGLTTSRPLWSP